MSRGEHLGEFEQIVLLAVARLGREGYGVTVRQEIQERTGRTVAVGAVYATLDRLVTKKMARESDIRVAPSGPGRPRTYYRILPDGLAALDQTRRLRQTMWHGISLPVGARRRTIA
jgi:DNA-binding PadR family transcriptional regulator